MESLFSLYLPSLSSVPLRVVIKFHKKSPADDWKPPCEAMPAESYLILPPILLG
jgi:hypothetical protein